MPQIIHPARSNDTGICVVADEEAELDNLDAQPTNQDQTTSEAVEWEDELMAGQLSDGGDIADDDEMEMLGVQA